MHLRAVSSLADAELVADLAERCWRPHYTPIIGGLQVDYMLGKFQSASSSLQQNTEGRDYRIIENEGSFIGYLAFDLSDHLFLSKLYVLPNSQGHGAGRWAIEQLAQEYPKLEMRLTVNKHNHNTIAFYQRVGFVKDGPIVADIGNGFLMDDWKMHRPSYRLLRS